MISEVFWMSARPYEEVKSDAVSTAIVVDLANKVPVHVVMERHCVKPRGMEIAIQAFRIRRDMPLLRIRKPTIVDGCIRVWSNDAWSHVVINPGEYLSAA